MDGSSSSAGPSGVVGQDEQLDIVEASATTYTKIETLQDSGINVADVAKLKAAGYATINSIVSVMRKDLVAVKGLGEAKVVRLVLNQKITAMSSSSMEPILIHSLMILNLKMASKSCD